MSAGGGVPKWHRDLKRFIGLQHFSWTDFVLANGDCTLPEWEKAKLLARWLVHTGRVLKDDTVVADGFWADGYADLGVRRVISVAHGIWSHLTKDDVDAGKQPEFPYHHAAQVAFRRRHLEAGREMYAVSDFIANQLKLQWGWDVPVVNNGVDLDVWKPVAKLERERELVIHGVTTANKGFDHIEAVKKYMPGPCDVWLLDEAAANLGVDKPTAFAMADYFVHPSAYEGNSYATLEALACGTPIVGYDVGLMWYAQRARQDMSFPNPGAIIDRNLRSPEKTADALLRCFASCERDSFQPRKFAELFSIERFGREWSAILNR
jgi:glycosyltransferase involved in cell wall biosynthesis